MPHPQRFRVSYFSPKVCFDYTCVLFKLQNKFLLKIQQICLADVFLPTATRDSSFGTCSWLCSWLSSWLLVALFMAVRGSVHGCSWLSSNFILQGLAEC